MQLNTEEGDWTCPTVYSLLTYICTGLLIIIISSADPIRQSALAAGTLKCIAAAANTQLQVMQRLRRLYDRRQNPLCPLHEMTCVAAKNGQLEVLQRLRSQDHPVHGTRRHVLLLL